MSRPGPLILGRAIPNASGEAVIAKTLDRDLGLVTRHSANPRPVRNAAVDLEAERLDGRLCIGRNSDIDEIGHVDLPVLNVVTKPRHAAASMAMPSAQAKGITSLTAYKIHSHRSMDS
jgi:hypothetical protein